MDSVQVQLDHLFDALPTPGVEDRYTANRIDGIPSCHFGVDGTRKPVLLIEVAEMLNRPHLPSVVIENMSVIHGVSCRILCREGSITLDDVTVIECTNDNREMQKLFVRVLATTVAMLGIPPKAQSLTALVNDLVSLFRALSKVPSKSLQGAWGELFVISQSSDVKTMISAWHCDAAAHVDFALGDERLEIKTTTTRERKHHFSLEQVTPPRGCRAWVCSLFVERASVGVSVNELVRRIRQRISSQPELIIRFEQGVAEMLGNQWTNLGDVDFDWQLAADSVEVYDVKDMPSMLQPIPAEISHVHFVADISNVPYVTARSDSSVYKLLSAAFSAHRKD